MVDALAWSWLRRRIPLLLALMLRSIHVRIESCLGEPFMFKLVFPLFYPVAKPVSISA
jgi:hypothetical protein